MLKCSKCHQRLTVEEYMRGYCTASKNSFHQVSAYDTNLGSKVKDPDHHLGAVGGE
jgi:hypothetical protein